MELDRRQRHLQNLLGRNTNTVVATLVPIINSWHEILNGVPGLFKRNPGSHCRISQLQGNILTVEVDHPAWMQLLHWNQRGILNRLSARFPELAVQAIQFRLSRADSPVERPNVVMPDPVKTPLTNEEQAQMEFLLSELEQLIHQRTGK